MPHASSDLFKGQQYINLETYRKNGTAVRTPVWFAQEQDQLYIWTDGASGKARRIRHTTQVRLTPSDARGNPKVQPETWVTAKANLHPVGTAAYEHGQQLLNHKYGLLKRFFEWMGRNRMKEPVVIEIQL